MLVEGWSGKGRYAVAALLGGAGALGGAVAWRHVDWMVGWGGLVWCDLV